MSLPFDPAPLRDNSQRNGFSGNQIVRWSEGRSESSLAEALAHPESRFYLFSGDRPLLRQGRDADAALWTHDEAVALGLEPGTAILLGLLAGTAVLAGSTGAEGTRSGTEAVELRAIAMAATLPREHIAGLAQARSYLHWHGTNRFCSRCGGPSVMKGGGGSRVCTLCATEIFPRVDPVVIMLAVDGERCLMGRQPRFEPGRYSALAGFLEPGETIEEAVTREIKEEAGITVARVRYHSSQVWPFPSSLMIGCHAEAISTEVVRDAAELEDCRWFEREEVRLMLDGIHPDGLSVPPPMAIAWSLIAAFAGMDGAM